MKSLVVYYSRTNITKKLAQNIASKINADIEEIKSTVNYQGKLGYARGIKDGRTGKTVELEPLKYNPADYDTVYLGGPVWASNAANPLISYIRLNKENFKDVKFFLTAGGSGFETGFEQMEKESKKPLATLSLTTKEVKKDDYNLDSFLR